jgi:hypothetical protein
LGFFTTDVARTGVTVSTAGIFNARFVAVFGIERVFTLGCTRIAGVLGAVHSIITVLGVVVTDAKQAKIASARIPIVAFSGITAGFPTGFFSDFRMYAELTFQGGVAVVLCARIAVITVQGIVATFTGLGVACICGAVVLIGALFLLV